MPPGLLALAFAGTELLLGGLEGLLEADEVFAGLDGVERFALALDLLVGVVGGLDGEADATLGAVDLDDAGFDVLADLEDVLDLVDAIFAELRDVDEAVDVIGQLHKGAEAGELGDLALDDV